MLERWNPTVKAFTVLVCVILLSFEYLVSLNLLVLAVCLLGSGTLAWRQWQAPPDVNGALDLRLLAGELAPAAYLDKDSAP